MRRTDVDPIGSLGFDGAPNVAAQALHDPTGLHAAVSSHGWSPVRLSQPGLASQLSAGDEPDANAGAVLSGRLGAPGRGGTDGGALGPNGRRANRFGPAFDTAFAPGAYGWWYLDALSEDIPGQEAFGISLIAFIGSAFSPYYALNRRLNGDAGAAPQSHCAVNVSLYHRRAHSRRFTRLWAMTERGRNDLVQESQRLKIGPSQLTWATDGLHIDVNEWTAPLPRRLRGHIHVQPLVLPSQTFTLDAQALHWWQPISPVARVEVNFTEPSLNWQGKGYLDSNHGQRPLEHDFTSWQWARLAHSGNRSQVLYECVDKAGEERHMHLGIDAEGNVEALTAQALCPLPTTAWGLPRSGRGAMRLADTLESGPFYARSLLNSEVDGQAVKAIHETLSLNRLANPLVRAMLPFRMPRWAQA